MKLNRPGWISLAIFLLAGCSGGKPELSSLSSAFVSSYSIASLTLNPVYPSNANWNSYVKFDNSPAGSNPIDQDDTACTGSETGEMERLSGCIHGGEKRKLAVTGYPSCSSLTASDSLGAFSWKCFEVDGVATFYSTKLNEKKGLRDLIASDGTWKLNSVNVYSAGNLIGATESTKWWNNPLVLLPDNSGGTTPSTDVVTLSAAGTIYYLPSSRSTIGYHIGADSIGLVILEGSELTYNGDPDLNCLPSTGTSSGATTRAIVCGGSGRKFTWIEGQFNGGGSATMGLALVSWKHSRVHFSKFNDFLAGNSDFAVIDMLNSDSNKISEISISGSSNGALRLDACDRNILSGIQARGAYASGPNYTHLLNLRNFSNYNRLYRIALTDHSNTTFGEGLRLDGSDYNIISGVKVSNIGGMSDHGSGLLINYSENNVITKVLAFNNNHGIYLTDSGTMGNTLAFLTTANNNSAGIYFNNGLANNYLSSVLSVNNNWGIYTGATANMVAYNVALANNQAYEVHLWDTTSAIHSSSYFIKGAANCSGPMAVLNSACARSSGSLAAIAPSAGAISTAFVGSVSYDSANSHPTGGASFSNITDWFRFASPYRGWGQDGTFGDSSVRGPCLTGDNCRIFDWRLSASSPFTNISFNGSTTNGAFNGDGSVCTSNALGSGETLSLNSLVFHKHAIEINDDWVGNDNGLCESNENCIYAPNLGAYQGEPDGRTAGYCTLAETGLLTNVKVFAPLVYGQ